MVDENRPQAGWGSRVVKGFYKSWAWLCAVFSVIIAYGPDVASLVLEQMGVIAVAFPSLSTQTKAFLMLFGHLGVIFLRPIKQPRAMRPEEGATVPVAIIRVPETVAVGPDAVVIATEIEQHERKRAEPGPPA